MTELVALIEGLTDFRATCALDRLAVLVGPGAAKAKAGGSVGSAADEIAQKAAKDPGRPIEVADPGEHARRLLILFSSVQDFRDVVKTAIDTLDDTRMAARPLLTLGTIATLFMIAASTEVEFTVGTLHVHKHAASPELVEAISNLLKPLAAPKTEAKD